MKFLIGRHLLDVYKRLVLELNCFFGAYRSNFGLTITFLVKKKSALWCFARLEIVCMLGFLFSLDVHVNQIAILLIVRI